MPRRPPPFDPSCWALVVVDMQRYYLEPETSFFRYFEKIHPGAMDYLTLRCQNLVLPNLERLIEGFRRAGARVCFLRLCGERADRSDLHPNFQETSRQAQRLGFEGVYPLASHPHSEVCPRIAPQPAEAVFCKTTYSAFTSSTFEGWLQEQGLKCLAFAGLATCQCVDTTARDAADRGYQVIHLEDALADYDEVAHRAALYGSAAMCGGHIWSSEALLGLMQAQGAERSA